MRHLPWPLLYEIDREINIHICTMKDVRRPQGLCWSAKRGSEIEKYGRKARAWNANFNFIRDLNVNINSYLYMLITSKSVTSIL